MKEMSYKLSGESRVTQDCIECDNTGSGDCTDLTVYAKRTYTWDASITTKSLEMRFEGFENDKKDRCTADSGDDCHEIKECSKTVDISLVATFGNGPYSYECKGEHHGMQLHWTFS